MIELSTRTLNRTLLARQLLLDRAELSPLSAIEHLVGLQAQAPNSPYLGLSSRLRGFDPGQLSALMTSRAVVRIALQRSTIHLVSAADAVLLRRVLKPVAQSSLKHNFGARLKDVDLAALGARGRELVEREPLTFAQLGELLAREFPHAEPNALAQGVRQLVPLVQVPPRGLWGRGGAASHTSLESWLATSSSADATADEPPENEIDEVILRYLAAFGPASVRDVQAWCGLTRINTVMVRLGERVRQYLDSGGTVLYDVAEGRLVDENAPAPVRLLPDYDNILLSHADRTRIFDPKFTSGVFVGGGRIQSAVLVDGFVSATWRFGAGTLTIDPLRELTASEESEVEIEATRMLGLLAPNGGAAVLLPR